MIDKYLIRIILLFVVFVIVSCDFFDDDDPFYGWDQYGKGKYHLVYTTFNVGLAPTFVPLTDERLEPLKEAISSHEADVICLEEVWLPEHEEAIQTAAGDKFPYAYSIPPEQKFTDQAACTDMEIDPLVSCIEDNCPNLMVVDAICVLANCSVELNDLQAQNSVCAGAVIAQVGRSLEEAIEAATNPAPLFAFGGSNGLLMLSKYPLENTQLIDFADKSTSNHRVALFATVEINGQQHALGCTHLTANLKGIPYTGPFSSWEEENYTQVMDILSFAETYADDKPVYLAGDFNCSIAYEDTGVDGDFEESCQQFLDAGYHSSEMDVLGCSYCEDNLLNIIKGGGEGNLLLDHIFIKNPLNVSPFYVGTVFDDAIEVETSQGLQDANLSDHFGVRVKIPL